MFTSQLDIFDLLSSQNFLSNPSGLSNRRVRIQRKDNADVLTIPVPGLSSEDISIEYDGEKALTISGSSEEFKEWSFKERFTLNDKANVDGISAEVKNGLLTVAVPHASPKAITIPVLSS